MVKTELPEHASFHTKTNMLNTSLPHRKNKNSTIILSNGGHLRLQSIGLVYDV
jgi:hypothetical protein